MKISEITNFFIFLENKYELFNLELKGIKVWELIRVQTYINLQKSIFSKSNNNYPQINKSKKIKLKFLLERLKNIILHNPFYHLNKVEVIVFESSRKYLFENKYIDIYTKYLCDKLKRENVNFEIYRSSYEFDKLSKYESNISHLDFIIILTKIFCRIMKFKIAQDIREKFYIIQNEIEEKSGVKINILHLLHKAIKEHIITYYLFNILFKFKRCDKIYLTNYSDKSGIIYAAKKNFIETIELQHGFTNKNDLIYHFPNIEENSLIYFPDKFWAWNNFPMDYKLPIIKKNVKFIPYWHLENIKDKYQSISKNDKAILVISQDIISQKIADYIINNIKYFDNFIIYYKLHPLEETFWNANNKKEIFKDLNNIILVGNESSIYELMAKSKYCMGVFSTALLEAFYLGCTVVLLDLEGSEFLKSYINNLNILSFTEFLNRVNINN